MRAIYAVSFTFPDGTSPDDVLDTAGSWFARGSAPTAVRNSWEAGRRLYDLPLDGHTLEVEVFESDEGRLWQGTWRQPHSDNADVQLISDVEVAVPASGPISLSLVIRAANRTMRVAPIRFEMRAPRLTRDVVKRFGASDGDHEISAAPTVLDAAAVPEFIDELLLDPARTLPVVFASDDPRKMAPNLDPVRLARELAGLAHVYTSLYGRPGWELERRLGPFGCRDGAVRIWWPGLSLERDSPYGHPLLTSRQLNDWHGPPAQQWIFDRVSNAAAMNGLPSSHTRLRRAGRLAQVASATDAELHQLLSDALDEQTRVEDELKAERAQREESELELQLRLEEVTGQLRAKEQELDDAHRNYAGAFAAMGEGERATDAGDQAQEVPELHTVRDAVDVAAGTCPHLAFADSAFTSADNSPFDRPELVLDALQKLDRVAELWARAGGIGGSDIGGKAQELGLDWKAGISHTALNKYTQDYSFRWNDETRTMGPHVRLGSGSGAGNIARIYLDKYEPAEPMDRRIIVAHVGRKLRDTTT